MQRQKPQAPPVLTSSQKPKGVDKHAERDARNIGGKLTGLQTFLRQTVEVVPDNAVTTGLREKPDVTYVAEHVYGFAGDRYRSVLYFGKDNNEIVYPAAGMGIVQDLTTREQRIFGGGERAKGQKKYEGTAGSHQDDITDLSLCPYEGRNIVATGELGAKSTVHVWDTTTMTSISSFSLGPAAKGVATLGLSPCQRYIAVVDNSNDHTMTIYNVNRKKMIIQVSAGTDAIFDIQWSNKPNDLRFAAVTTRSLQFWHPADATKKLFKNGTFGQKFPQTKFLCVTFDSEGLCYSGGANGSVHCWDQRGELGLVLKAHAGECTAVACSQGMLLSTGKDYKVTVHSANKGQFEFLRQIPLDVQYQASALDYLDGKILVGHDNGRIITVDVDGSDQTLHNSTHHDGECWGLEIIPENGTFLTCGDDNQFHEISMRERKVLRSGKIWQSEDGRPYETNKPKATASTQCSYPVHQQGRAIAYSGLHGHVAVSNNYGDIAIYDYNDFSRKLTMLTAAKEWSEVMKYSPDGRFLAVGGHDDAVYIYTVSPEGLYKIHYTSQYLHSSAVTALDWSRDSRYVRAIDQAYAKIYYDAEECVQVQEGSSVLTDPAVWQTSTCKLGWDTMGAFPPGSDGTDINAVDANADRTLLAAADDFGTMTVYRFPCMKNTQDGRRVAGHSEHVTRVRFHEEQGEQPEDDYERLITAGGADRTYIQWKPVAVPPQEDDGGVIQYQ